MGQLKDTLVSGNLRVTDDILANKINGVVVGSSPKFTDTNTWRGIQDNLTSSTNTTESLSAKQGYLLANGSARDSTKLPLAGGTLTGTLTISPTQTSSYQAGLILHDSGSGGSEALWINWTSGSYSDGVKLMGCPDSKLLKFHNGTDWNTVIHSSNYTDYVNTTNFPGLNKTGTITSVGNTNSGAVTVSSSNNTASFGSAVTVGTVGGIDLKFTMPSNPNTDTKVNQSSTTTSNWRKIILSYQDSATAEAAVATNTNVVYGAVGVEVQPSTGTLKATVLRSAGNNLYIGSASSSQCHQQYDTTNKCLKFIFD